jgi:acyl-CoA reductase-like NAD-dependent aldehyde dehydrogenase
MHALHTGDPLDPATALGPLASTDQWTRVNGFVRDALASGAQVLGAYDANAAAACHFRPVVIDRVGADATIAQEEVFGPVATLHAFDTPEEALAMANGTRYGLSASVWVEDDALANRLACGLRAGMVTMMGAAQAAPAMARGASIEPVGLSGFGAEGGRAGLLAYTRARHVSRLRA